ncbi:DUF3750 domain-containing protein [Nitratireductor sp. StC3]|uniref:DUF3750 domain-containing protein n=1 Tax=Nitratireductor sp. StC3 TaxID=2126741 RepID=UPI000D0DFE0F|nr:DUF3750 domain-containing protein [Nitratireductor sp. StC3]PSM18192.1 DUF3750 domain-containing protein [Nitratireductor sp. StC3]
MRAIFRPVVLGVVVLFALPAVGTALWWSLVDRPASWRSADWSSSGLLPAPKNVDAAIYVLAARTGGFKGAFSSHSWIVLKRPDRQDYDRYDKVGWGLPVRHNGFVADGYWYSNPPRIVQAITGEAAASLLPVVEAAIATYPFAGRGDYRIWPGPNSNSFVAHVLRRVPQLDVALPANAVGRDYAPGLASVSLSPDRRDLHVTLGGFAGLAVGRRHGFEIHLFGLVAGVDIVRPALKIPAYGRLELLRR